MELPAWGTSVRVAKIARIRIKSFHKYTQGSKSSHMRLILKNYIALPTKAIIQDLTNAGIFVALPVALWLLELILCLSPTHTHILPCRSGTYSSYSNTKQQATIEELCSI